MSNPIELPVKCQDCAKSEEGIIQDKCSFCREIQLSEATLCHLNRSTQEGLNFQCYAFQPLLKVVSSDRHEDLGSFGNTKENASNKPFPSLNSDTMKYQKALALQKLNRDPEEVFIDIKYHFAWNVVFRRPIFSPPENYLNFMGNIFFKCSELIGGFVNLITLAVDHVHVYVE